MNSRRPNLISSKDGLAKLREKRKIDQRITKDMFNKKLKEYKEKQAEIREEMGEDMTKLMKTSI